MKILSWVFRIILWIIVEFKGLWITLLPISLGVVFCWLIPVGIFNGPILCDTIDTRFRLTGLILEVLGIFTVVYGVIATLKLFNADSLWKIFLKKFKQFPKLVKNHQEHLSSSLSFKGALSTFVIKDSSAPDLSIENRLTFLEEQMKQIQGSKIYLEKKLLVAISDLGTERSEREAGDKQAQHALKKFAIGDIYIELMGIIWLIFGAIFATASTELAKYFG